MARAAAVGLAVLVSVCVLGAVGAGCGGGQGLVFGIDPGDFVAVIDNPLFPLEPGTTFIYEANTPDGLERREMVVTQEKKDIIGVACTVVRDTVTVDGAVAEIALDWCAQDQEGTVWYFGEDSKDYENGQVVSTAGSWEAGVNGARPGIIMKADPQVGDSYRQEVAKGVAEDRATVVSLTASITVPYGSFTNCLRTRESTPLEPGVVEFKLYARDVGCVKDAEQELVSVTQEG